MTHPIGIELCTKQHSSTGRSDMNNSVKKFVTAGIMWKGGVEEVYSPGLSSIEIPDPNVSLWHLERVVCSFLKASESFPLLYFLYFLHRLGDQMWCDYLKLHSKIILFIFIQH